MTIFPPFKVLFLRETETLTFLCWRDVSYDGHVFFCLQGLRDIV